MLDGGEPTELTRQNVQARIRGQRMWNWANSSGALFLQTGDMSEKAVGYTTMGGDLEGALSVIANVPKTVVIALLERLHRRFQFEGIAQTLATDPGPELADAQVAENELMPFAVLDACLHLYAGEKMSPDEVETALVSLFPHGHARPGTRRGRLASRAVHAVDLQVGAVAARAARWLARPRSRARPADAGRAEDRVDQHRRLARRRDDARPAAKAAKSNKVTKFTRRDSSKRDAARPAADLTAHLPARPPLLRPLPQALCRYP